MKKVRNLVVIAVLFVILGFFLSLKSTSSKDVMSINYTYIDVGKDIISEVTLTYNTGQKGSIVKKIILNKSSIIDIYQFDSENACLLEIRNDNSETIFSAEIVDVACFDEIINEETKEEFTLVFSYPAGYGRIGIKILEE